MKYILADNGQIPALPAGRPDQVRDDGSLLVWQPLLASFQMADSPSILKQV